MYDVTFNVSTLEQSIEPFEPYSNAANLKSAKSLEGINEIACNFFDGDGNFFKSIISKSTDANFGIIKDKFPKGSYSVSIAATNKSNSLRTGSPDSNKSYFTQDIGANFNIDLFAKELTVVVGESVVNENIELKRVVGQVEIELTDDMTKVMPEANSIGIAFGHNNGDFPFRRIYYPFSHEIYYSSFYPSDIVKDTNTGYLGNKKTFYSVASNPTISRNSNVTFTVRDTNGGVLFFKSYDLAISVYPNKKTVIKGSIFDDDSENKEVETNISIADNEWDSDIIEVNF